MSKTRPNPNISLIRPPFFLPGDLSFEWSAINADLKAIPVNLFVHDTAFDFFKKAVVRGDHLHADRDRIARAGDRLISQDTVAYSELLQDADMLNQALEKLSTAFPLCRFHRYGFAHEKLSDLSTVQAFAADAVSNPFWEYADSQWRPFPSSSSADLALVHIGRPGQVAAALTLAMAWQRRWPQIPLKLLCPRLLFQALISSSSGISSDQWPFEVITDLGRLYQTIGAAFSIDTPVPDAESTQNRDFELDNGVPLVSDRMHKVVQYALEKELPMVAWRDSGEPADAVTSQMYAASRQGLWNHLILHDHSQDDLRQFASANANIVHSYCHEGKPASALSDPVFSYPSTTPAYGRTQPMPGRPLWMALKDPAVINKGVAQQGPKTLMRLRVKDDGRSLFEVGQQLRYHFKPPEDLPPGYLEEIVRMVAAGGSVNTQFVRHNLERAYLIAYVEEEGVIVGNSSLKQPRQEYMDAVSRQSGIDLHHYLERGYTSVRPEYRGLGVGVKLLEGLTQRAGDHKIFSVIAESNVATQKMAMRNRTRRVATFYSQRANKEMSVWIPEWMLPEGIELPAQPDLDADSKDAKDGS